MAGPTPHHPCIRQHQSPRSDVPNAYPTPVPDRLSCCGLARQLTPSCLAQNPPKELQSQVGQQADGKKTDTNKAADPKSLKAKKSNHDEQLQADYYRDVMIASFSHPNFVVIVQWGFWEKMHLKPAAALWREDGTLKRSGEAFVDLVANQWWTDETITTDALGKCQLRGFLGDYKITVQYDGKTTSRPVKLKREGNKVRIQVK